VSLSATLGAWICPFAKKSPHTIPQWLAEDSWFFITINCVSLAKNQLCRVDTGDAVLTGIKFDHEKLVWHFHLCLMPDHPHAIIAFPREPGIGNGPQELDEVHR